MKAVLVIDIPDEYADRYNVENMYVWNLVVQDKHGYAMLDLVTDKPNHLRPLPHSKQMETRWFSDDYSKGWNDCLDEILEETE